MLAILLAETYSTSEWDGPLLSRLIQIALAVVLPLVGYRLGKRKPSVDEELISIRANQTALKEAVDQRVEALEDELEDIKEALRIGAEVHSKLREGQKGNTTNIEAILREVGELKQTEQQREHQLSRQLAAQSARIDETVRSVFTHATEAVAAAFAAHGRKH